MAENSAIEWTDHTWNPWVGCSKVSPGCQFCYAEQLMDTHYHFVEWGPGQPRRRTTADTWNKVRLWDRKAAQLAERPRVFCASLADWADPEVDVQWRVDMWALIRACTNLDFLMLSKRPEYWLDFLPLDWLPEPWKHVWLGVTAENQEYWDRRVRLLTAIPAVRRFVSCEPLLGPIDLRQEDPHYRVDWLICGGESTARARPMDPAWALSLRDQCVQAGVPFFFKQWGEWLSVSPSFPGLIHAQDETACLLGCRIDGKVYMDCEYQEDDQVVFVKVGKKKAGHHLDGVLWNQFPPSAL